MEKDKNLYQILVVEDNPGDRTLIIEFLEEEIASPGIFHVWNFKECKHLLTVEKQEFNVILLDLSLPDKNGENLIREILSICPDIPIIVLTGHADVKFSVKSLSLGICDYLLKDDLSASSLHKSIVYSIERKKKSIELEESEKRYSNLFHLSPQPMWVYEIATLKFIDVNAAAIKHYGYSRNEFLSMTIRDIRPEEDLEKLEEAMFYIKNSGKKNYNGTFRHRKKNGDLIQIDIQANIVQFKGMEANVVLATDITERLNYINAIEKQNEKLKEIAWMQSHVVRAPVARIMSLADLIKTYENTEEEQNEFLDYILHSARELDSIIRDISDKTSEI